MSEKRDEAVLCDAVGPGTDITATVGGRGSQMREMLVRGEPWLWFVAMLIACLLVMGGIEGRLYNDSYQYLSMAHNLRTRGEIATSIIEFDTERSKGRIPAPATTVAPGYPVAIRMVESTGLSPERAGLLISLLSMAAVVPLLWLSSGWLGATRNMQRAVVLCWAINSVVIALGTSVISEGLFILLSFGGVVLLLFYEKAGESSRSFAVPVGMALIGLSYCVRYAGVLVVAALCVYTAWRVLFRRDRIMLWIASLAGCLGIVTCGMIRNAVISGTWRGGNDLVVHTPASKVLHDTVSSGYHLFFGFSSKHVGIGMVIWAMAAMMIAILLRRSVTKAAARVWSDSAVLFLLVLVGGYIAGMIYLGMTTMIIYDFNPRYFLPILPEGLLLGAAIAAAMWRLQMDARRPRLIGILVAIALCGYVVENIRDLHNSSYYPGHVLVAGYFQEQESTPLEQWVETHIPPDSVVLATDGQASAYALHRNMISLVSPRMSHGKWDEEEVRQTMAAFRARYLITYPGMSYELAPEQDDSPFLHSLVQGEHPSWLVMAAHNSHVAIFEDTELKENTRLSSADR